MSLCHYVPNPNSIWSMQLINSNLMHAVYYTNTCRFLCILCTAHDVRWHTASKERTVKTSKYRLTDWNGAAAPEKEKLFLKGILQILYVYTFVRHRHSFTLFYYVLRIFTPLPKWPNGIPFKHVHLHVLYKFYIVLCFYVQKPAVISSSHFGLLPKK